MCVSACGLLMSLQLCILGLQLTVISNIHSWVLKSQYQYVLQVLHLEATQLITFILPCPHTCCFHCMAAVDRVAVPHVYKWIQIKTHMHMKHYTALCWRSGSCKELTVEDDTAVHRPPAEVLWSLKSNHKVESKPGGGICVHICVCLL